MNEFQFLRPAWLLALVPALVLLVLLWRRRAPAAGWRDIVSPTLLPHLLLDSGQGLGRFWLAPLGLGWLLAVTALAGPTWERQPQPVYRMAADRVLVLDMSPSMAASDIPPDRLTRTRLMIRHLLAQWREGRTALVVFGAEPHIVTPLTDDAATIEALLPALTVDILPALGDRGGPALRAAGDLLARVGSARGQVLLLSDGISDPADSLNVVHELRRRGVRTSVLGVGTLAGARVPGAGRGLAATPSNSLPLAGLDETGLVALARAGAGRYLRLGAAPLTALLSPDLDPNPSHAHTEDRHLERWVEKGPWLLLPLVLMAASAFRRGWLGVWLLLLIPFPQAHAVSWQDWWLRADQQASRLLEQGQASAAAERFQDPQWRATARYQAGDYASAAEGFTGQDPASRYNRGNALARAGRLQEAIAAYDQVLQQEPDHDDARFNRALIAELLREQQRTGRENQSSSAPAEQQPASDQTGRPNDNQRQASGEAGAGQSETGDAASQTPSLGPQAATAGTDQTPQKGSERREPTAAERVASKDRQVNPWPGPTDSRDQARSDVAPAIGEATQDQQDVQGRPAGQIAQRQRAATRVVPPEATSEQELALEQWLRQVPDDPAGLLRRKFMLEHLMRQKRQQTP